MSHADKMQAMFEEYEDKLKAIGAEARNLLVAKINDTDLISGEELFLLAFVTEQLSKNFLQEAKDTMTRGLVEELIEKGTS